jgi:anti-anti-sigma regulatory factor
MVFSFFKKPPEKMVARPAVTPRSAPGQDKPARGEAKSDKPARSSNHQGPVTVAADPSPSLEASDFVFSESSPDFQIEGEIDPIDAEAEKAAVLFANAQDDAVCASLEEAVRMHRAGAAERLWLMLFDLYRLTGKEEAFSALAGEYAAAFERAAPSWAPRAKVKAKVTLHPAIAGAMPFAGNLTADNIAAFEAIRSALQRAPKLRLDMSPVAVVDAVGCGRLLMLLQQAAKAKRQVELLGRDSLGAVVERSIEAGRADNKECWLLLLELCQLQGRGEAFEEVAIDYAVTFEVSPPSWEADRVAAPEPPRAAESVESEGEPEAEAPADAYVLQGDVKSARFGDVSDFADAREALLIDCTRLRRIDFISAGALLNALSTVRRTGKQIVFHHPNHLVAELFGVVGLTAIATIVFARR